ncbi:MAG TPA: hypothetical protein PK720_02150 [bacterium]|nr:hypothetical protein [bacterium]
MKKIKIILSGLILSVICLSQLTSYAQAGFLDGNAIQRMNENTGKVQMGAGYDSDVKLGEAVAIAIKGFLSLLGVIFVILIIISGYNWMTASGDEEKIKKATSTIRSAIIGLLIVVAAYSITYFVFANLPGSDDGAHGALIGS